MSRRATRTASRVGSTRVTAPLAMGAAIWLSVSGCSRERADGQMTADLERDLAMAMYARPAAVVSSLEGGPRGGPSGDARGRRDVTPQQRRVARPAPVPEVQESQAEEPLDTPLPAISMTPAETSTESAAPMPEIPAPSAEPSTTVISVRGPSDAGGNDGDGEGRRGGGVGRVIGAIIRGGAAGVDNCEEHDRRRGRGGNRGPILTTGGGWGRGVGTVITVGGAIISSTGDRGAPRPTYPRY